MPADAERRLERLSLVVFSGDFERVHYALVMASAAAAVNTPATLFFTMEATRALLAAGPDGRPGWHALPGAGRDADFAARGVATFEELLQACVAMGVTFMVCEMGLRAVGLTASDLRGDVPLTEGGVVTWLHDASPQGGMLFL